MSHDCLQQLQQLQLLLFVLGYGDSNTLRSTEVSSDRLTMEPLLRSQATMVTWLLYWGKRASHDRKIAALEYWLYGFQGEMITLQLVGVLERL